MNKQISTLRMLMISLIIATAQTVAKNETRLVRPTTAWQNATTYLSYQNLRLRDWFVSPKDAVIVARAYKYAQQADKTYTAVCSWFSDILIADAHNVMPTVLVQTARPPYGKLRWPINAYIVDINDAIGQLKNERRLLAYTYNMLVTRDHTNTSTTQTLDTIDTTITNLTTRRYAIIASPECKQEDAEIEQIEKEQKRSDEQFEEFCAQHKKCATT